MDFLNVFVLSVIEGVTEFLPISSTGHMIVASRFLNLSQTDALKAFEVIIQLAAILAIVLFYKSKLSIKKLGLWLKVLIAFLPVGLVGFVLADVVKSLFSVSVVAVMFIVGGAAFLVLEHFYKKIETERTGRLDDITYLQALKVGLWQVLALIPGTSRSGATIFGGMVSGLSRQAATEFSFLTALPVMLAAAGYDLVKHSQIFNASQWQLLSFGFVVSFLIAYITVKLFLKYVKRYNFVPFGWYRIVFGLVLIWFYFLS
ncbi:MAG: undecaprenyl-diphosphate phosphatase [bacterium]|nr:undecaprenyl-diphosphate phosphatase [bacterium]